MIHSSPSSPISAPDPLVALGFARQHGLEEGSSDDYLKELRAGEEDDDAEENAG